jgi:hypothetical protein
VNHLDESFVREYCARTGKPLPEGIAPAPGKRSKYGNVKTVVDGVEYDSKREAARAGELALMQKAGEIRGFAEQVRFLLADRVTYIADFVVLNNDGTYTVEDAKGFRTDVYKLKRRLMRSVHGIEIKEV